MEQEKLLSIRRLTVDYQSGKTNVHAVRNLSLDVGMGETLGFVGETGAGKTTTALSILRILPEITARVRSGEIFLEGEDLMRKSKREMRGIRGGQIAMIFQDPMTSLDPVVSVGKQIEEMIRLHTDLPRDEVKKHAEKMLELVGIRAERFQDYPHQFSGGMKQRVMIAIALSCSPKLLIADEPTTALDVTIQDQILRQLRELDKEYGASIIFITHDLGVVAELCDRVLVMYGGLIMEEARIEDIFERPGHPYTMGLLHSIPDVEQEKSERLEPIPGSPPDMTNPPAGCPFAPRCSYARKVCAGSLPDFVEVGEGHRTRCFLQYEDAPADEHNPFRGGNR